MPGERNIGFDVWQLGGVLMSDPACLVLLVGSGKACNGDDDDDCVSTPPSAMTQSSPPPEATQPPPADMEEEPTR